MPSYHVWNEVYPFLCIGEQVRNIRNEKQFQKECDICERPWRTARGVRTHPAAVEDRVICGSSGPDARREALQPLSERDWRLAQTASPSVWLDRGGTWKGSGILLESPNIKRAAQSPPWVPWAGRQLNTSSRADTNRWFGQELNNIKVWKTIVWINCKFHSGNKLAWNFFLKNTF